MEEKKQRRRMLIADSSQTNRFMLSCLFADEFDIELAADYEETEELLHKIKKMTEKEETAEAVKTAEKEEKKPDVILLGEKFSGRCGLELLAETGRQLTKEIPVLMLLEEPEAKSMEQLYELGAVDFLMVPFEKQTLQHRVRNAVQLYEKTRIAFCDTLTGLRNHARARALIEEMLQENPQEQYAMAIFDLDNFKAINDNYGHMLGDDVLKYVAERLRRCAGEGEITARVGGDEFLLFFRQEGEIKEKVRKLFAELNGCYGTLTVSVCMGIAGTKEAGREYRELFCCADRALYAGKRKGSGQCCFYQESMKDIFRMVFPC